MEMGSEARDRMGEVRVRLVSIALITLTAFIGVVCTVALAATLTQARISSLSIEGVSLSVWKLEALRQQWDEIRTARKDLNRALGKAEQQRAEQNAKRRSAEAEYDATLNTLLPLLEQFYHRAQPLEPELAALIRNQSPSEQFGRIQAARESLRRHPELEALVTKLEQAYAAFQPTTIVRARARAAATGIDTQVTSLKAALEENQRSLDLLFGSIKQNLDEASRSRIETALYELRPTAGSISGLMNKLVTAQPDVLTLSLVIMMGVLGSALQITNSFFRRTDAEQRDRTERIGSYFLRLGVGAITALVIFIVAKAGVPIVADASKLGGDAPINPYFVSFLAIVSGLLSENAIVAVQSQGTRLFGPGGSVEPYRWARDDLSKELQTQGVSPESLAQYLGCSVPATNAILTGEEKASPEQQRTIATFLRKHPRDLFTDIARVAEHPVAKQETDSITTDSNVAG
jgi:hypothetical protein